MPADAMPLEEPPARASATTRQAPGTALTQEQWNRRPVAQRGETPKLEQEWRATDDPNRDVVPGEMRSDREEIPAGFTKSEADKAETMEAALAGGDGAIRALVAPGCQVYWPAPYEVCGAIRDKYNELGGPNSFLLFPKTNELTNPDGIGKRTEFLNGPIYWSPQGGAHPVVNHFLAAWARHGYENSYIGYPTTDEIVNPDGLGRRQHFTGSTIYWKLNEAYSIGGAIADKWHQVGAESGTLGYPTSDELVLSDGVGRLNLFESGAIAWHPAFGARVMTDATYFIWQTKGLQAGIGYPIEDEIPGEDGGPIQEFSNGRVDLFQEIANAGNVNIGGKDLSALVIDYLHYRLGTVDLTDSDYATGGTLEGPQNLSPERTEIPSYGPMATGASAVPIPSDYYYVPGAGARHDFCTMSPDYFPSLIGDNADFRGPCARHDMCMDRADANGTGYRPCHGPFRDDLNTVCKAAYSFINPNLADCLSAAAVYHAAVVRQNPV